MAAVGPSTRQSTPTLPPEPDEKWKATLRAHIQRNLAPMVKEAEENLARELNTGPVDDDRRQALHDAHAKAMNDIRRMAQETYSTELECERQQRRWAAGGPVDGEWTDVLAKREQAIMNEIKEKAARSRSNTLEEERKAGGPSARSGPPQGPPPSVMIPQSAKNTALSGPAISPSDSMKSAIGANPARRPSHMSDTHPRPFRDGPPKPELENNAFKFPMNSANSPSDSFPSATVHRRPSHMSDQRPTAFRPRGESGGEEHNARWVPAEPSPSVDAGQTSSSGRPRQGSAGSQRSLGDGSLDRWMPQSTPEEPAPLSRKPTTVARPMVNGRGVVAQGWRPALPSDDRSTSSRTFDLAKGDGYDTTDANAGTGDEAEAVAQEWSRVARGKPRRHDRAKQRTGPSSPSLLDPPRPAASQQVSLVEVRRTSSSPLLDAVELPLARPIPTRRPGTRVRSRSPLGMYSDGGSRSPPNGPSSSFQPLVAPEERRLMQPHPLLTRPQQPIAPSPPPSGSLGLASRVPSQSNIAASRPLVRRRSFSAGESPMNSPPDERDWYHVPRDSPVPMDDRHEPAQRSPWGAQPSSAAARAPTSASPHSPGWWGPDPPNSALSGKFRRGSSSSLRAPAEDGRSSVSPAPGPSSSRPVHVAKKRSINFRDDPDGPGGSASSPRSRNWFGPAIPEDGKLEEFAASPFRDDGPPPPPPPPPPPRAAGASSRSGSLRSRGSRDMRPAAHEVFIIGRRRSNNYDEPGSDEAGSDDGFSIDRRSIRSLELEEVMRREREAVRREEDARKKEDDARRKEDEAARKEEEARKEKEEARRREEDARRREEENRMKEEEVRTQREELRRREEEIKKREEEFRIQVEEARRKEDEFKRKEEEALALAAEMRRKEEEVKQKEEEAKRMRDEAALVQEDVRRKEEDVKRMREEARKQQQEHRRQLDEAKREAKRKLEDAVREAKRSEEDARRQLDDAKREAKRREEDFQRREQELARWEEELARREVLQKREKELMEREELLRQREEMQRRKDALERERLEDEESRRLEEELRQQELDDEEEERLRQEELLRMHEEQFLEEEDIRLQEEEEARLLEIQAAEQAAEEERLEKLRQEELRQEELRIAQEEEDKRRRRQEDEEARRQDLFRKKQAEEQLRQDEELARRLAEEEGATAAQRKAQQAQYRKQELDMHKQHAERQRRDQGAWRSVEEDARRRDEELRRNQEEQARRKAAEDDRFRSEEEHWRRANDRGRYDSTGSVASASASASTAASNATSVPRPIPPRTAQPTTSIPIAGDRTSTGSSNWSGPSSASAWSASTRATSATSATSGTSASTARPMNFPSAGTTPPTIIPPRPSATPNIPTFGANPSSAGRSAPPLSEGEWARRQAEQAKKQQEAFRREQERQEREKQSKASRALTREDALAVFQKHEQAWQLVRSAPKLRWDTFPWPVFKRPSSAEELTTDAVGAYVLSPHHPTETAKSNKDRVKDHIKRWHPDRFETQLLPKVNDEEKERVKEGAGWVARALNELLTRINSPGFFD